MCCDTSSGTQHFKNKWNPLKKSLTLSPNRKNRNSHNLNLHHQNQNDRSRRSQGPPKRYNTFPLFLRTTSVFVGSPFRHSLLDFRSVAIAYILVSKPQAAPRWRINSCARPCAWDGGLAVSVSWWVGRAERSDGVLLDVHLERRIVWGLECC